MGQAISTVTCPVKWFLVSKILKDAYQLSETKFMNIEASEDLGDKISSRGDSNDESKAVLEFLDLQVR